MLANVVTITSTDTLSVTAIDGRVEGTVVIILVLTGGGTSAMIIAGGKFTIHYSANARSIVSIKSNIEDSIVVEGISSKLEKLDSVKYC